MGICKRIRRRILYDYIDGELDKEERARLERHLHDCVDCSSLVKKIREELVLPFRETIPRQAPEHLWPLIKERIEKEAYYINPLKGFIAKLSYPFSSRFAAPVFSSFILLVLIASMLLHNLQVSGIREGEREEYMLDLLSANFIQGSTDSGLGTSIEEHFL